MLASFFSWWTARITELLPRSWISAVTGAPDGVVVDLDGMQNVTFSLRRGGRQEPVTLGAAARLASRMPVIVRPPSDAVLRKSHVVPTAARRELEPLLRHELARITPFAAEDLFWTWDARPRPGDRTRLNVTLMLVPKRAIALALDRLAEASIAPRFIETGPPERPRLLRITPAAGARPLVRVLVWSCGALAVVALVLPVALQEFALRSTDAAIDALRPAVRQVETLRHGMTADGAGNEVLARETERTGDVLQILATVTRILPDDTYLTDFSLRDRHMTLGGRSAAAARLITGLSSDPTIRNAAFAAPVTRIDGSTTDVFSIRAEVAP